jgi:hypothetical protein
VEGQHLRFRLRTSTGVTTLDVPERTLLADVDTFVLAVYDGARMAIYQDGVEIAAVEKVGSIASNPAVSAWIGDSTVRGKTFHGTIDEVRIWSRALAPAEIGEAGACEP